MASEQLKELQVLAGTAIPNRNMCFNPYPEVEGKVAWILLDNLYHIINVVEAAELALITGHKMPVQLYDERGATMGYDTYASLGIQFVDALGDAVAALSEALEGTTSE
jgi:hypothetical protein